MYELRTPARDLGRFIEHYWFVTHAPGEHVDLRVDVFVDGRADLIFNFGAPYQRQVRGGAAREIAASNLDAQRLEPIRIVQSGAVRTIGARFRLGGLGPFVRSQLRAITGACVPPSDIFGEDARVLEDALRRGTDLDEGARLLDAFFRRQLALEPAYQSFARALAALEASHGSATVEQISSTIGGSSRRTERLFARYLGIAPKVLGRVLRFQGALKALMRDPQVPLAEVAVAAGYFDQAHFVKDFRRMTGGVPRGYRGYFPPDGPSDFAPNVVVFLQDAGDLVR